MHNSAGKDTRSEFTQDICKPLRFALLLRCGEDERATAAEAPDLIDHLSDRAVPEDHPGRKGGVYERIQVIFQISVKGLHDYICISGRPG